MLLCADIGNTNITIGIFDKEKLLLRFEIPTRFTQDRKKLYRALAKSLNKKPIKKTLKESIICSVVPRAGKTFKDILLKEFNLNCLEVGKNFKVPIKNCYLNPAKVGQDRLVNAVAAVKLYGKPAIVIDFGTCVTFDCISQKGEYLGGLIMPGIGITLDALYEKTALLPKIKMYKPHELIGRTTKESIASGLYNGFLGASNFIIEKTKKKLGKKTLVIATGGNALFFKTAGKFINQLNLDLTLQGLYIIYNENQREKQK
ncbi:MAG: type III pantothenate kinase [Candidatus Omnitrophota bacterium]